MEEGTMGRIKTQLIKRTTLKLLKNYPTTFTEDFKENKELVSRYIDTKSKKIRNVVAGYVTRLMRKGIE
jgi:small subunit ribosomal protein S17e